MASPFAALRNLGSLARTAGGLLVSAASASFAGPQQGAPNVPPPNYSGDQPTIATAEPTFRAGYHDHQFAAGVTVFSFGGFGIVEARAAIEEHDTGVNFYQSGRLAIALTRFGPVTAALAIRVAQNAGLARQINGGPRGLSRIVAAEVADQLCPRSGLLPSRCFPSTLWGSIAIEQAMMGFAVLQHCYGPPDERGVRRIYTRRWPTWAVRYDSWRRTYVAITTECDVDILNDGKFTLIGKTDVPHLQGAVRALAFPVLDGAQVQAMRAQWINRYSDPKLVAYMPKGVAVGGPEGLAFMRALASLRNPGGFGALPDGSNLQAVGLDSKASASFNEALTSDVGLIYAILTGADPASASGGVYKSPQDADILHSTVGDDLAAQCRAINEGHVWHYIAFNHAEGRAVDIARGVWVDPVLSAPLPDPKADARIEAKAKRMKLLAEVVTAEKAAGGNVIQDRVNELATALETPPFLLAVTTSGGADIYAWEVGAGIFAPDEVRERKGAKPLPDDSGSVKRLAADRAAGKYDVGGAPDAPVDGDTTKEPATEPAEEEAA
jgi:hypothetical protein